MARIPHPTKFSITNPATGLAILADNPVETAKHMGSPVLEVADQS